MVTTVYGDAADGVAYWTDVTWSVTDASPAEGIWAGDAAAQMGRYFTGSTFKNRQLFFQFDTSSVVTVSAASLFTKLDTTGASNLVTAELTLLDHDWGPTLATADFLASSSFSSYTTLDTASISDGTSYAYVEFVYSDTSAVNAGASTYTHLVCTNQSTAPVDTTDEEEITCYMADQTGTADDPYLSIDETAAPPDSNRVSAMHFQRHYEPTAVGV